ncbi:MAG: guanylate kinase [Clostridiales bacterium]|nr:guanylate kinase [Clostridiales bacterium]
MNKLFVLMGKSASGKDTIYKKLLEDKRISLKTIVPYTTRPIRHEEKEGVEYHFVSRDKFEEMKENKLVIESRDYQTVHGVWSYFTAYDRQFSQENSKDNYLMINTLNGYEQIRDYFGKDNVVPLYIYVEDGIRLTRALKRERRQKVPKYAEMCRRYLADDADFSKDNLEKAGIDTFYDNENIERCMEQIVRCITVHSQA